MTLLFEKRYEIEIVEVFSAEVLALLEEHEVAKFCFCLETTDIVGIRDVGLGRVDERNGRIGKLGKGYEVFISATVALGQDAVDVIVIDATGAFLPLGLRLGFGGVVLEVNGYIVQYSNGIGEFTPPLQIGAYRRNNGAGWRSIL